MPYTVAKPKALMRLGDHSILEILLRQMRAAGFERVTLCVSHLGHLIREEFAGGENLGLNIDYCVDEGPLGTAGPLRLVPKWESPALVLNADVLTTVDFADLMAHHRGSGAILTIAKQTRPVSVDYGVLYTEAGRVREMWEKPSVAVDMSLGIYVADPGVCRYLPHNTPVSMSELICELIRRGEQVGAFAANGRWHDIGTPEALSLAHSDFVENIECYLPDTQRTAPTSGQALGTLLRLGVATKDEGTQHPEESSVV